MTQTSKAPLTDAISVSPASRLAGIGSRMLASTSLMLGLIGLGVALIVAFVLPVVLHLDPYAVDPAGRLAAPSAEHIFGTDNFGRDLFSRIVSGASTSIMVGFIVALVSGVVGAAIGILAIFSPLLDQILMRICDGLMAIPAILLAVALAAALGPSVTNLVIALSIVYTPGIARLVRSRAMAVKSETFVAASVVQGASFLHIMWKHILPNTLSVLVVQSTFTFAESVITEAAMSFLGAGVPAPHASWGNILYDGKSVIAQAPHMIIITSLFLIFTVLALNLLGDGLRDMVDRRAQEYVGKPGIFARLAAVLGPRRLGQKGFRS
jgi:peptide/nickel transport system permease protein